MQRLHYIGSLFWSGLSSDPHHNVKPQDQINEILKVPFNIENPTHCEYLELKLKAYEKNRAELTDANLKIAAASGLCLLLNLTTNYNSLLSWAGYSCLIAFAFYKTERTLKKETLSAALGELYDLMTWCHPDKTSKPNSYAERLLAAIEPYNLDAIDKNKYLHFYETAKTSAHTTWSAFNLAINGRRFASQDHEAVLPTLK